MCNARMRNLCGLRRQIQDERTCGVYIMVSVQLLPGARGPGGGSVASTRPASARGSAPSRMLLIVGPRLVSVTRVVYTCGGHHGVHGIIAVCCRALVMVHTQADRCIRSRLIMLHKCTRQEVLAAPHLPGQGRSRAIPQGWARQ